MAHGREALAGGKRAAKRDRRRSELMRATTPIAAGHQSELDITPLGMPSHMKASATSFLYGGRREARVSFFIPLRNYDATGSEPQKAPASFT